MAPYALLARNLEYSTTPSAVTPTSPQEPATNRNRPYKHCVICHHVEWVSAAGQWWRCGHCGQYAPFPDRPLPAPEPRLLEDVGELATKPSWADSIKHTYQLQRVAKGYLCQYEDGNYRPGWDGLRGCHRYCHAPKGGRPAGVEILVNPLSGRAVYAGLQTCASPWVCPVCAAVIWQQRKQEIAEGLAAHRESGGAVLFITLTASHHHNPLEPFLDSLTAARRAIYTGGTFTRFKKALGYLGSICAVEITWSYENGWHPHFHILWMVQQLSPDLLAEVNAYLQQAWPKALQDVGLSADVAHGVTVKESSWDIEEYMTKIGHERRWDLDAELTARSSKNPRRHGIAALQLLDPEVVASSPTSSKVDPRRLFCEYAKATRYHHSLRWSPGLRAKLGLAPVEDDQTAAASEAEHKALLLENDQLLLSMGIIPIPEWRIVVANDCIAELRVEAGHCDPSRLTVFLKSIGVSWKPHDPGGGHAGAYRPLIG